MAERLTGATVRLVPLDVGRHFENILRWANDPDVSDGLRVSSGVCSSA